MNKRGAVSMGFGVNVAMIDIIAHIDAGSDAAKILAAKIIFFSLFIFIYFMYLFFI